VVVASVLLGMPHIVAIAADCGRANMGRGANDVPYRGRHKEENRSCQGHLVLHLRLMHGCLLIEVVAEVVEVSEE
jgi:hypothetical protein